MGKKLKKYNVISSDSTLTGLSVVEYPAVEQDFICFSKDQKQNDFICLESEVSEKHRIVGVALRPDFPIYRNYGDEEFYIEFSKECVEKMSHKFFVNGAHYNMNTDHDQYTNGLYVCESWIVEDAEKDKSNLYGLNAEVGSWVVMCQVTDIDLWESFKNGERKGFSVEAWCDLEEIIENKDKKENDMSKQKTNLETMEVNDGFWDKLKGIIAEAMGTSKDDKTVEDAVEEAKAEADPVEEVVEAEEQTPEVPVDEVAKEVIDTVEEGAETTETAAEDLQTVVDKLQEEVDALKAENAELLKKNQNMSKKPSAKVNVKQSAEKGNPRDVIEALYNGSYFK